MKSKARLTAGSIRTAAARLNISPDLIREAKRLGCDAWDKAGRVDTKRLAEWMDRNGDKLASTAGYESKTFYEIKRLKAQITAIELRNKIASGELIRGKLVQDSFGKFGAELISTLRQKLENEYPHRFAGLDIPGIRKLSKGICDELVMIIFDEARKWDVEINASEEKK